MRSRHAIPISKILQIEAYSDEQTPVHLALLDTDTKGFEVVCCHDMADGLEKLQADKYDLVILDATLSRATGLEGLKEVRRIAPNAAVIFMVNKADEALTQKALQLGAQDYLIKQQRDFNILARVIPYAIERKRSELERERLIREQRTSEDNIKTLRGLLPICACCKKIRDDKGYWSRVEEYISRHSSATFTHGYCPQCAQKVMEEYEQSQARQKKN